MTWYTRTWDDFVRENDLAKKCKTIREIVNQKMSSELGMTLRISCRYSDMGLSENSVPLLSQWFCWSLSLWNGYFIGKINPIFRQTHISQHFDPFWASPKGGCNCREMSLTYNTASCVWFRANKNASNHWKLQCAPTCSKDVIICMMHDDVPSGYLT